MKNIKTEKIGRAEIKGKTIAVWFSCGAASAVAAKLTIEKYGNENKVIVLNNPIKEECKDNTRFLSDVENWIDQKIIPVKSKEYPSQSCVDVWEKRRYMSGIKGAPCTMILKKRARQEWEEKNLINWHVLGFTREEKARHNNFILTERENLLPVLIESNYTKYHCFETIKKAGMKLPIMYKQGYPNANCIGCVKATSPTYWNHVRKVHPKVFEARCKQSDKLNVKLVRYKGVRIKLKDLPKNAIGRPMKNMDFECGIFCEENFNRA